MLNTLGNIQQSAVTYCVHHRPHFHPQVAVRREWRKISPVLWLDRCQLEVWWAASPREAQDWRAAARPAVPAWSEAAGRAGRARRSFTTAATSSWAACSLSSALLSLLSSGRKRKRWWSRLRPAALAVLLLLLLPPPTPSITSAPMLPPRNTASISTISTQGDQETRISLQVPVLGPSGVL